MKKAISILLALAMLLFCAAAFAETAAETAETTEKTEIVTLRNTFTLKCNLPESYTLEIKSRDEESVYATLTSADTAKPLILISIAYNDLYAGIERMNDIPEEDLAMYEAFFTIMDDVKFEYKETGYGTKIMMVTENFEDTNFIDFYTIYKGFEVEFVMTPGSEALTDADVQMMMDFITDLDFVPVE